MYTKGTWDSVHQQNNSLKKSNSTGLKREGWHGEVTKGLS